MRRRSAPGHAASSGRATRGPRRRRTQFPSFRAMARRAPRPALQPCLRVRSHERRHPCRGIAPSRDALNSLTGALPAAFAERSAPLRRRCSRATRAARRSCRRWWSRRPPAVASMMLEQPIISAQHVSSHTICTPCARDGVCQRVIGMRGVRVRAADASARPPTASVAQAGLLLTARSVRCRRLPPALQRFAPSGARRQRRPVAPVADTRGARVPEEAAQRLMTGLLVQRRSILKHASSTAAPLQRWLTL